LLRIGIVGGAGAWHARAFSEMFNGFDEKVAVEHNFPLYEAKVESARVTHIWDSDMEQARLLAGICKIDKVTSDMEELIEEVDGVIVADDRTMKHQKRAVPFLEAGMPTMIDKPLSSDIDEADRLIELARKHKAPIMSCSALRYAREVEEFKRKREEIGQILTGNSICSGDLVYYGIHALEQLYVVIGPGIRCVQNVGDAGKDIVMITLKDSRTFVLIVYKDISYLFQMNLYGTEGWREIKVEDSNYFYSKMLEAFVGMVRTREMPFPPKETLEIIKALVLARKSANEKGRAMYL